MTEHSARQRLAVLTILADADEIPGLRRLGVLLGCKHRTHPQYYLNTLAADGLLIISDTEDEGGRVVRQISMTDAAWKAIGRAAPPEPKTFIRRWARTTAALHKIGKRTRAADEPQKEPEPTGILASLGRYDRDWDGDNFRRVSIEDMRRRYSPRP